MFYLSVINQHQGIQKIFRPMAHLISNLILAPRKDNFLVICLLLGFLIMVTGSWLNSQQQEVTEQDTKELIQPVSPSEIEGPDGSEFNMYATAP